mgnify:CR=1 FL=1
MAGSEAPPFWFREKGWAAYSLAPLGWVYGAAARWRMDNAKPFEVMAPVMCIGNLTVGGSGKTPTAIAIAKAVREEGYTPGFLTRGYGGSHPGPHLVDLEHDTASAVGDEPLLLARVAPTIVSRNRAAGARKLLEHGVDFIVMDDGFQSRKVYFDYALIALDARRGLGNGSIIPAGPLRAPVIDQMRHADALLRIGDGAGGVVQRHDPVDGGVYGIGRDVHEEPLGDDECRQRRVDGGPPVVVGDGAGDLLDAVGEVVEPASDLHHLGLVDVDPAARRGHPDPQRPAVQPAAQVQDLPGGLGGEELPCPAVEDRGAAHDGRDVAGELPEAVDIVLDAVPDGLRPRVAQDRAAGPGVQASHVEGHQQGRRGAPEVDLLGARHGSFPPWLRCRGAPVAQRQRQAP